MRTENQPLNHRQDRNCKRHVNAQSRLTRLLTRWPFWICAVIAAGIAWRVLDYYLRYPVWTDEASLGLNIIHRSYAGLLRPLNFAQVAPLFFLWTQKFIIDHLGTSALSIRFLPFAAGVACLPLAWMAFRPAFGPRAALVATALIVCSLAPVRLTCDAKPYSIDLLFSLIFVGAMARYLMAPGRRRWLIFLCVLTPVAVGFSFPCLFVLGASSLAAGWQVWRRGKFRVLPVWIVLNILAALAFAINYHWIIHPQSLKTQSYMDSFWKHQFPPHNLGIFWWLIKASVSEMMSYPFGRNYGFGLILAPLCLIGALRLVRSRGAAWGILLAGPFALTFLASIFRHYPFGGAIRLQQQLLPSIAILSAWGLRTVLTLVFHNHVDRKVARAVVIGTAVALVGYTFVQMPMDIHSPYGHGFRSMMTLRRIVHRAFNHAVNHTEIMVTGPAWHTAREMEPEIYWYFTTQTISCNTSGRIWKSPLENKQANLWVMNLWLPKDALSGRTANQHMENQIAKSGLHLHLKQNKVYYLGELGFNYHAVYCQVQCYTP